MTMRKYWLVLLAASGFCSPAQAMDESTKTALLRLDPVTRLEQRCDIEVMDRIKQSGQYNPDRVVAYATREPKIEGDEIKTRGAAFRSRGNWYGLEFKCQTEPDHLTVRSIRYKIGAPIPEEKWQKYYLFR